MTKTAPQPSLSDAHAKELWHRLLASSAAALAGGFGVGAAGYGAFNLGKKVTDSLSAPPKSRFTPLTVPVPLDEEEEHQQALKLAEQYASSGLVDASKWGPVGNLVNGLYEGGKNIVGKATNGLNEAANSAGEETKSTLNDWLSGRLASNVMEMPFGAPAVIGSGIAGGVGGVKLMHYLTDSIDKTQREQDIAKAKKDYEAALLGKTASAGSLGNDLDKLYDLAATTGEKRADFGGTTGTLAGVYLTLAGLASAVAAKKGFDFARKRQPGAIAKKVTKKTLQSQAMQTPPVMALPSEIADEA